MTALMRQVNDVRYEASGGLTIEWQENPCRACFRVTA